MPFHQKIGCMWHKDRTGSICKSLGINPAYLQTETTWLEHLKKYRQKMALQCLQWGKKVAHNLSCEERRLGPFSILKWLPSQTGHSWLQAEPLPHYSPHLCISPHRAMNWPSPWPGPFIKSGPSLSESRGSLGPMWVLLGPAFLGNWSW